MQNLADSLTQRFPTRLEPEDAAALSTFVVFNERRYVTSSAKRARKDGSAHIHQTPDGSFLDLMRNAADLLARCGVAAPPLPSNDEYVAAGCVPPFVFLWNPALGPLWQVVAEKVRGGSIAAGSDVCLEVAELRWRDVHVAGSLQITAEHVVGHTGPEGDVVFSDRVGRVVLEGVTVQNAGVDVAGGGNCFWKADVQRTETCRIVLRGCSEIQARDVCLAGDVAFDVPDGFRLSVLLCAMLPCS